MDTTEHPAPTSGLTPHLTIRESQGARAIDFYREAFGAEERERQLAEDGVRLMHAHLVVNGGSLMLNDDFPEWTGGIAVPAAVTLHLEVDDPDRWWDRAVAAGAIIAMPLDNQFWSARYGRLQDPFGHHWSIGGPVRAQDGGVGNGG